MAEPQILHVTLDPAEVLHRLGAEVGGSYWLDVLNYLLVRKEFVGFLGIGQSTIWRNGFHRSSNRPRLRVRVEPARTGSRIEYQVDPPTFGDIFFTMQEDEGPLLALLPRLFADVQRSA